MSTTALSFFISALGLGTMITVSSHHWILAWMGLEMNTLAIIPLMSQHHHPRAIEATIKYFLTQASASALILFASINNAWVTGEWDIMALTNPISVLVLTIAVAMKIGLAPFHFWLPEVLQGLDLTTGLILSTWQKLAPITLLFLTSHNMNLQLLLTLAIVSTLVGGWGGLNQTHLRKILAYSSIAHLGWMAAILTINPQLTLITLILYIIMTASLFLTFKLLSSTKISTLSTSWSKFTTLTSLAVLSLLSLGGLPPLSGFLPKWLIIQELSKQNGAMIATLMALSALLSLFFYLRLTYAMTLTMHPSTSNSSLSWRLMSKQTIVLPLTLIMSILLLPITPSLLTLIQ
uniref:NADH-ubiquinone oxidoreductase chain 2 n=1 Tax=Scaphiopus holbrookii TaxID=8435 RepID=A0A343J6A2_9ANUR|nr:NADH dehydrogenase subunit 2 [Scaphiopus holbrookii]ASV64473.1 NADH dehydrogenase subunit 2 [Scaphiopus holbrookii]